MAASAMAVLSLVGATPYAPADEPVKYIGAKERQGARAHDPTIDPRPRGRGHRMSHPLPVLCQGSNQPGSDDGLALQMKLPPTAPSKHLRSCSHRLGRTSSCAASKLRPELLQILEEEQGRAFWVSR